MLLFFIFIAWCVRHWRLIAWIVLISFLMAVVPNWLKVLLISGTIGVYAYRYWNRRRNYYWPRWKRAFFAVVVAYLLGVIGLAFSGLGFGNRLAVGLALTILGVATIYAGPKVLKGDAKVEELRATLMTPKSINLYFFQAGLYKEKPTRFAGFRLRRPTLRQLARDAYRSRPVPGKITVNGVRYQVPKIKSVELTPSGLRVSLTMLPGMTVGNYLSAAEILPTLLQILSVQVVESHGDRTRGRIQLTLVATDPLAEVVPFTVDPSVQISVDEPWIIGRDTEGEGISYSFPDNAHAIIAGATRSGKSVCTYSAIVHLLRMGNSVRVLVCDPNDTTIAPFVSKVSWSTSDTHPEKPTEMLKWLRTHVIDARKPLLRDLRADKITEFTAEVPLYVVIIDEAANYMRHSDKTASAAFINELMAVVAQGAKFGIRLMLITQRPDATILPTPVRSQLSARISFRLEDKETAKMVFPDIEDSSQFLTFAPGVGMFRGTAAQPRVFRSVFLEDHWGAADRISFPLPRVRIATGDDFDESPDNIFVVHESEPSEKKSATFDWSK